MAEFPLLPIPTPESDRRPRGRGGGDNLRLPGRARQGERLGPVFERLRNVFEAGRDPATLREDPTGIAPERALVMDVAGNIDDFYRATQGIDGLEFLGDEETEVDPDEDFAERDTRTGRAGQERADKPVVGRLYLAMPDTRALQELLRLWDRHQRGGAAPTHFAPWFALFDRLRQFRAWGPQDRIPATTTDWLAGELEAGTDPVRLEIELWSYQGTDRRPPSAARFEHALARVGGEIIRRASIAEIAYEAALVDVPAAEVVRLRQREESPLAISDDVMFIRPQSTAEFPAAVEALGAGTPVDPAPSADLPAQRPRTAPGKADGARPRARTIAALLDGVPCSRTPTAGGRVLLRRPDDSSQCSVVSKRRHGTALADSAWGPAICRSPHCDADATCATRSLRAGGRRGRTNSPRPSRARYDLPCCSADDWPETLKAARTRRRSFSSISRGRQAQGSTTDESLGPIASAYLANGWAPYRCSTDCSANVLSEPPAPTLQATAGGSSRQSLGRRGAGGLCGPASTCGTLLQRRGRRGAGGRQH